jgi:peroxiredoxin
MGEVKMTAVSTSHPDATIAGVAQPAPDFELQSVRGDVVRLSRYRGQRVVLLFFSSGLS